MIDETVVSSLSTLAMCVNVSMDRSASSGQVMSNMPHRWWCCRQGGVLRREGEGINEDEEGEQ